MPTVYISQPRPLTQFRLLLTCLIFIFSTRSIAQESEPASPAPPVQKQLTSVTLFSDIQYKEGGTFSDAARAECPLDKEIIENLTKVAERYQLSLSLTNEKESLRDTENALFVRIDHILGGRPGNGFGGRWVVSELGVTSFLGDPANPKKSKYYSCSAGLGANPFGNLEACQRLSRCTRQVGTKIAAWLRQELAPKAAVAKSTPVVLPADTDDQTTQDKQ